MSRNKKFNNKQGKNVNKGYFKEDMIEKRNVGKTDSMNDVNWYVPNDQILNDSASFAFSNALGAKVGVGGSIAGTRNYNELTLPGICRIQYVPTYGLSTSRNSALMTAARNIYSFVRHANSGHSNYDAPDLMMYICAIDNLYTLYWECVRAYGAMRYFRQKNLYLAKPLVQALGFEYEPFISNMADFRLFIQEMALKLNVFAVPKTFTLFQRHMFMASSVFCDSSNLKGQLYAYVPAGIGYLDEMNEETGAWGKILYEYRFSRPTEAGINYTFDTYANVDAVANDFYKMYNKLISSEDFNIMSGDIMKAYGTENCVQLAMIGEDYTTVPAYQPEVLPQIMNTRAFGPVLNSTVDDNGSIVITLVNQTDDGVLTTVDSADTYGRIPANYNADKFVFNLHEETPTPADVMVASRMTPGIGIATSQAVAVASMGSEIAIRFDVVTEPATYAESSANQYTYLTSYLTLPNADTSAEVTYSSGRGLVEELCSASIFDWFPIITVFASSSGSSSDTNLKPIKWLGDLDNYTVMQNSDVKKMHDTALYQELGIPFNGIARR